jgi:Tuberculosis necrotizing toxin
MTLTRRIVGVAATWFMVCGLVITTAPNADATASAQTTCSNAFLDGDSRLGPALLPTSGPIFPIVAGYHPLAGLTAPAFLSTYWDPTANGGSGGWRYPPDNGFVIGRNGQPEEMPLPLAAGERIDRFGSVLGTFLAPINTPYAARSLPPMSLDNFTAGVTCNYSVFKVEKSFEVESGPIAPGFGQRGLGRQYQLVSSLIPRSPASVNVMWLLDNGYLANITTQPR